MQPRFGIITKVIAGAFALAGIGAGLAAFGNRSPAQVLILCLLTAAFLLVAVGMWTEFVWAWWAGAAVTLLTVVIGRILKIASVGIVWPGDPRRVRRIGSPVFACFGQTWIASQLT